MRELKEIKILLVDDEANILQFLEIGLQEEGFDVLTAQDGMTAVTLAKQFQPHIVIFDVMMPGMDGFEVCRMLKKTEMECWRDWKRLLKQKKRQKSKCAALSPTPPMSCARLFDLYIRIFRGAPPRRHESAG
jgi:CheY-like chemotaxis protein